MDWNSRTEPLERTEVEAEVDGEGLPMFTDQVQWNLWGRADVDCEPIVRAFDEVLFDTPYMSARMYRTKLMSRVPEHVHYCRQLCAK